MPELKFTDQQKAAYKAAFATDATEEQFALFISECERRALVPGVHVVFQLRNASEYSKAFGRYVDVKKVTLITTINALRLIAERTNKFRGYGKFVYYYCDESGAPTITSNIPLGRIPHAVSVELFREGWAQPVFAVARYDAYVQTSKKGDKESPTRMWMLRGEEQLAKCAEASGLRMIAPEECGGLYIAEEFANEQKEEAVAFASGLQQPTPIVQETAPVVIPTPTVAPVVNQAAAEIPQAAPAAPAAPAKPPVAPSKPPAPPKPPAKPPVAPPAPAAPPKPPVAPVVAKVIQPAPETTKVRQPAVEEPVRETHAELEQVADAIARDKDKPAPAPAATANVHGVNITDEDLPENLRPGAEQPAKPEEYQQFVNKRAATIVRDKLPAGGMKQGGGDAMKNYLLKSSGKSKLQHISAAKFEELLSALEKATPEEAVKIVKGVGK